MSAFPAPPPRELVETMTVPPQDVRRDPPPRVRSPRIDALIAEIAESADPDAVVRAFWDETAAAGTPLVEDVAGGSFTCTFLHRGDAERVALLGNKLADAANIEHALFERIPGTDVWWCGIRFGAGWRGSYAIAAQAGPRPALPEPVADMIEKRRARSLSVSDPALHRRIDDWFDLQHYAAPDPLAREQSQAVGRLPSVAAGPDAPQPLPLRAAEAEGRIVRVAEGLRGDREMWWHVPAQPPSAGDAGEADWDVLVLLDGERWLRSGPVLDAWGASGILPPTVTLLVGSAAAIERRDHALTCSPELLADMVRVLNDAPEFHGAPLTRDPARTRIAGSSLGGLTAVYAQCAAPERFGVSISQSGSFWWPNAHSGVEAEWLTRAILESGVRLGTVSIDVGAQEWVLLDPTRRLRDALADRCDDLTYREFDGGHDDACWVVTLPRMLRDTGASGPDGGTAD